MTDSRTKKQAYYLKNKEACIGRMRARNIKIKTKVFAAYSESTICCAFCPESDIRILHLDHIEGGGQIHREECRSSGTNIYDDLIRRGFPPGFQILCPNCNHIKRCENNETRPANGKETESQRRYHGKLRLELIDAYSNNLRFCKVCNIGDLRVLCLDHIDGSGASHRRKYSGVYGTWRHLKRNDFPPIMQVLCQNCNRRKMHENKEFGVRFSLKDQNC